MVTPDAEKTMCTNLGIGALLAPDDSTWPPSRRRGCSTWRATCIGGGSTDAAAERAVTAAAEAGVLVALSLSDPRWVGLHRQELDAILDRVDLLFANEQEACGLTVRSTPRARRRCWSGAARTVAVTRGAHGSVVATESGIVSVPAAEVTQVVDTTGAGDSYAAGFLYGVVSGREPARLRRARRPGRGRGHLPPGRPAAALIGGAGQSGRAPGLAGRLAPPVRLPAVVGLLVLGPAAGLVGALGHGGPG